MSCCSSSSAIIGVPVATVAYFFLKAVAETQQYVFATLPTDLGFDSRAVVVADSAARAQRRPRQPDDPLPPRDGRAQAGRGIQDGRPCATDRASRDHHRGVRDAQPRGGARTRSSTDRNRQRHGGARRPSAQEGRAGASCRRDRCGRELRRRLDLARFAPRRRVPVDGGGWARWRDDGGRAHARTARGRGGIAHLRRAQRLDRVRHLRARGARHPRGGEPGRRRVPLGDRDRRSRGDCRVRRPATGAPPATDRRTSHASPDAGCRRWDRRARLRLRAGDGQGRRERALLGAGSARSADRRCGRVDRRRPAPPRAVQGARLFPRAQQLSRRACLPGHVHRRRRRHRAFAPSRPADDRRSSNGDRGDDGRDARPATRLGAPRDAVPAGGRARADPARDRRRRRLVRRLGPTHPRHSCVSACEAGSQPRDDDLGSLRAHRRSRSCKNTLR